MNCYVLAGGESRRMGKSKAELFLDRVVDAARGAFGEVIVVGRAAGGVHHSIVDDPHEKPAAIYGVARALKDAKDRCFILAVDYPLITSDVLRFLRDRGGVPMWKGKPQRLCAVWDANLLDEIEQRIAVGRLDLHGLNEQAMIPEAELRQRFEGEPLMNVNTPEEWRAAERMHGG